MLYIKLNNNQYELWIRYNKIVFYKLLDISKETAERLNIDGVKTISNSTN